MLSDTPLTLLEIGAEQTRVVAKSPGRPDLEFVMPLGSRKTAREHFRRDLPTPLELEQAIQSVEDEVMPLARQVPAGSALCSGDAALHEIALLSGEPNREQVTLTLEAMERTFNRLAAVVAGRPAHLEGLPATGDFAATLLILREFMHHLSFAQIHIVRGHQRPFC